MEFVDEELTEEYEGKELIEDYETVAGDFETDVERIILHLINRPYYTDEELEELEKEYREEYEDEDEDESESYECEERNWTVTMDAVIELEGIYEDENTGEEYDTPRYKISSIGYEDGVYGDDGLGDFDPSEVFSDEEFSDSDKKLRSFLERITVHS